MHGSPDGYTGGSTVAGCVHGPTKHASREWPENDFFVHCIKNFVMHQLSLHVLFVQATRLRAELHRLELYRVSLELGTVSAGGTRACAWEARPRALAASDTLTALHAGGLAGRARQWRQQAGANQHLF